MTAWALKTLWCLLPVQWRQRYPTPGWYLAPSFSRCSCTCTQMEHECQLHPQVCSVTAIYWDPKQHPSSPHCTLLESRSLLWPFWPFPPVLLSHSSKSLCCTTFFLMERGNTIFWESTHSLLLTQDKIFLNFWIFPHFLLKKISHLQWISLCFKQHLERGNYHSCILIAFYFSGAAWNKQTFAGWESSSINATLIQYGT